MSVIINVNDKSWVEVPNQSDFPLQNLPFGIFKTAQLSPRVGVALGNQIIDLKTLFVLGYLENLPFTLSDFDTNYLNDVMSKGKKATSELRLRIYKLFKSDFPDLRDNEHHVKQVLVNQSDAEMLLPVRIGDYTDFYSSEQHAYNVGCLFRDPENALLENWKHIPVGYHGRASSIIPSGQAIHRPKGQMKPKGSDKPVFGPSRRLDYELEVVFYTFKGKPLGDTISVDEAEDYIFGMSLFNDWSARDIQGWEYVPLGPFLGKNFASSVSPWIVTLDALELFRVIGPEQTPEVLPYLKENQRNHHFDIHLEVYIKPENSEETLSGHSNYKYMYWSPAQQLAHHSINGCNIRVGDAMASGTISGPDEGMYGSMLETSWAGQKPLQLTNGETRSFIQDYDTVIMKGFCEKDGFKIGFGEVKTKVLPVF